MSWRGVTVAVGTVGLVAIVGTVGLHLTVGLPWDREAAESATTPPPELPQASWPVAPAVLEAVPTTSNAAALTDALAASLSAPALGGSVGVEVIDLATGEPVYTAEAAVPHTPASTLKILTTAAALQALGPEYTFSTGVVTAAPGLEAAAAAGEVPALTLVGGGDPFLSAGDSPGTTPLASLADTTAAALTAAGVTTVQLSFDDSLFTGPAADSDWESSYVAGDIVAPIHALALDGGRLRPGAENRAADPAAAAAAEFAALLGEREIAVTADPERAAAPAEAAPVAEVRSAPLASVVERVLDTSDNEGAEILARHVAIAAGRPGTADDGTTAVIEILGELGVDLSQAAVLDGSGLARGSSVPAAAIAGTLALASSPEHPELRAVVTGLPVAGFTGTLDDRFADAEAALGTVRAKTGTLTGVSGLAGVTTTAGGGAYAFAVLAADVTDTLAARAALDDVAAAIAACACS